MRERLPADFGKIYGLPRYLIDRKGLFGPDRVYGCPKSIISCVLQNDLWWVDVMVHETPTKTNKQNNFARKKWSINHLCCCSLHRFHIKWSCQGILKKRRTKLSCDRVSLGTKMFNTRTTFLPAFHDTDTCIKVMQSLLKDFPSV